MSEQEEIEPEENSKSGLYELLNLSQTASDTDIREAHRRLSRLFHPDKHGDSQETRQAAEHKFREIQHAYDVLSDPQQRAVYDTLGEAGLSLKMDVGQRNMTAEELRQFHLAQARQAQVETLDALVQAKGETSMTVDAKAMFGQRVVVETYMNALGMPMKRARPALLSERWQDVHMRGLTIRQSSSIPFSISRIWRLSEKEDYEDEYESGQPAKRIEHPSTLTLTSHATMAGKKAQFGVLAGLRHQLSPKTTIECSLPLLAPRKFKAKWIHQQTAELFYSCDLEAGSFMSPPSLALTSGRQMTSRSVLFSTLSTGNPWKLWNWGMPSTAASYVVGWTRNPVPSDPTGFTVQLITGLQVTGLAGDYNMTFEGPGIRCKAGGSITTGGLAVNLGASRKITEHARLGAVVTGNAQTLVVKLTFARLGQRFSLPLWIGEGFETQSMLYGVVLPVLGLVAFEFLHVIPARERNRKRRLAFRKERMRDQLAAKEQAAKEAVDLMREAVERKQDAARQAHGLVIVRAMYGSREHSVDVTIPLAAQMNENQLVLPDKVRKSGLIGFWDPDLGEKKRLTIEYLFGDKPHSVEIEDRQGVVLPMKSHLV
jgi:DnaJ family protein C protein 11